jgi:hypothetical protein
MRRRICWFERVEDGVKREVEVSFKGKKELIWKITRSDSDLPKHKQISAIPSPEDWDELESRAENWYRRRALPFEILELIRNERSKSVN